MLIIKTKNDLVSFVKSQKQNGLLVGFVPTMGALHRGHLSLVEMAFKHADIVLASIFVNPTQFGPNEDLSRYPRQEAKDIELLKTVNCSAVYIPQVQEIYPHDFATTVSIKGISDIMCGAYRSGHFDGVATVVAKLLLQSMADVACFGEKDYQQLQIIKQLQRDLDIPTKIISGSTVRESSGLALSSRNAYLSDAEKIAAPVLYKTLNEISLQIKAGENIGQCIEAGKAGIIEAGFSSIDYLDYRHAETLAELHNIAYPSRLLVAARLGKTRLIDNIEV